MRPRMKDSDKRIKRHTLYLTSSEDAALREVAKKQNKELTKCLYEALHEWLEKNKIDARSDKNDIK